MYLIFDTETTGLPRNYNAPCSDVDNWPRLVQLAWQLHNHKGDLLSVQNFIVKPDGFTIPYNSEKIHGISTNRALQEGKELTEVLSYFLKDLQQTELVIGHNIDFDLNVVGAELIRMSLESTLFDKKKLDTKLVSTDFCALSGGKKGQYKWPTLIELYVKLFGEKFDEAHDASFDTEATAKCFFGLIDKKIIPPNDATPINEISYTSPSLVATNISNQTNNNAQKTPIVRKGNGSNVVSKSDFAHLHVHTQYSILQSTVKIKKLVEKAKSLKMPAVAITDLGNMMGAFLFVEEALSAKIKPIVGCEFYVAEERKKTKFTKDAPDRKFQQLLLAKNKNGYMNLSKLSSLGYTEGLYGLYPRIDKELIKKYSDNLIAFSGNTYGEIPNIILNQGEHKAEEALKWWLDVFGEDFYLEIIRHGLEEEERINEVLLNFAGKYNVKIIASNDVFYLDKEDAKHHDTLLCIKEAEVLSTPIGIGRGCRYGFPNEEYYFKTSEEMGELFKDIPHAISNISELLNKVETYKLTSEVLLPKFSIPVEHKNENEYLRYLAYEGVKKRYNNSIDEKIKERLDFELKIIENTGYPGYFLIVQDFIAKAREMGVLVGNGRGSAAGSLVAYCISITNVDPLKYNLLFERFLNPDRISLPDIDIDFDDEGRQKVIDYVVEKYGEDKIAQITTYGTMAPRGAIRDCARVMEVPLSEADRIAKLVPFKPGISFETALKETPELRQILQEEDSKGAEVLRKAQAIEGVIRNVGVHACGVVITPRTITDYVPISVAKDSDLNVTQFDNSVMESAGLLKMDFLGLKTLTIIKTAINNIKTTQNIALDVDSIPLDDKRTFELFQRGETNGIFQFESSGMQKYLKDLKPNKIEDLVAMNALYRPGPLKHIPSFINRKNGVEPVSYELDDMEEILGETYGITVYQEQVMLLAQKLANFTKGEADVLRKAMGKKNKELLEKLKPKFVEGCKNNRYNLKVSEKIWIDWEDFASYAFNKSHSVCYAIIAYQTAYLKANYPAEYMASVLTHNQSQIEKVTFFMEECQAMGLRVSNPNVNESDVEFTVDNQKEIRFGLKAIKGTGDAAIQNVIAERNANGKYKNIFDFAKRVNLRTVNKRSFEVLAMAGAFDCFEGFHRKQYLYSDKQAYALVETAIKYGNKKQGEIAEQHQLFGSKEEESLDMLPEAPNVEHFTLMEKLKLEKEVVGFYLSGHPLDEFKMEISLFCKNDTSHLKNVTETQVHKSFSIAGIITGVQHKHSKNGKQYALVQIEDKRGLYQFSLFGNNYNNFKEMMILNDILFIKGKFVLNTWKDNRRVEPQITQVDRLSNMLSRIKSLSIMVNLAYLDEDLIKFFDKSFQEKQGSTELKWVVFSPDKNIKLNGFSRKYSRVGVTSELLEKLKKYQPKTHYKIEI